jgi:phosphate transport system substrate-binding protein
MKKSFLTILASAPLVALVTIAPATGVSAELTGAGSTFVYPVISKWAEAYKKETGNSVNYQSIGSGGGIKQIQGKTVEFGATDMPLKSEELAKDDLVQFPLVNGAVVPVVHLTGVENGKLKLSGPVLADIFLGKIKKWNDAAITAMNKDVKLPDQQISVVHRSDGSGTSFIWTNYLSKVSPEWKTAVGEGTAVKWPAGVGGKGNEGVASFVKQIDGAIGYVEFAYAQQNQMNAVQMKNQAGEFITPNLAAFKTAAEGGGWAGAKDFYLILTDAAGKKSWPIAGSTFVLMHKTQENPEQAKQVISFFKWAYSKGQNLAEGLSYVPVPAKVTSMIEKTWKSEFKTKDGKTIAMP